MYTGVSYMYCLHSRFRQWPFLCRVRHHQSTWHWSLKRLQHDYMLIWLFAPPPLSPVHPLSLCPTIPWCTLYLSVPLSLDAPSISLSHYPLMHPLSLCPTIPWCTLYLSVPLSLEHGHLSFFFMSCWSPLNSPHHLFDLSIFTFSSVLF